MSQVSFYTQQKDYFFEKTKKEKYGYLDPNHSHYILVDNGTVGQFGNEIDLRALLEDAIGKRKLNVLGSDTTEGIAIPI